MGPLLMALGMLFALGVGVSNLSWEWALLSVAAAWAGAVLIQHDRIMQLRVRDGGMAFIRAMNAHLIVAALLCAIAFGLGRLAHYLIGMEAG